MEQDLYQTLNEELVYLGLWVFVLVAFTFVSLLLFKLKQVITLQREFARLKKSLSCDLHDEIGVNLAGISLMTECLKKKYANDPELQDCLDEIRMASLETDMATQEIVALLEQEREFKVEAYIQKMLNRFCMDYHTDLEIDQDIKIDQMATDKKRHLILFFKECLHNVLRHAKADHIQIRLKRSGEQICFEVEDNGIGFDATTGDKLSKLRQRCQKFDSDLQIKAQPQAGCKVSLYFREME